MAVVPEMSVSHGQSAACLEHFQERMLIFPNPAVSLFVVEPF
jgi:hypothetical protein